MTRICSVEKCNKKVSARGWCSAHYSNWQRHGDALYIRQYKKNESCIVAKCERKQKSKGYCNTHSIKLKRSGTLDPIRETKEYKEKWLDIRITDLSRIDKIRDTKRRGFLATNIVSDLQQKARARGLEWNLEKIDAYNLIISKCHYCGFEPKWPESRCGLDRVDNLKAYHKDNVVPCCISCNTGKGTKTVDEFRLWIESVYNRFKIMGS